MGIAAIAAGKLPDSFRTRQISLPAFLTVLSCASTWELRIAAMPAFLLGKEKRLGITYAFFSVELQHLVANERFAYFVLFLIPL
jgi:hypothetical protein